MKFINFLKHNTTYVLVVTIEILLGYILLQKANTDYAKDSYTSGILISIGTSLFATALIMILDIFRNMSALNVFKKMNNITHEAGLQWIYKRRDIEKYHELMEDVEKTIDIAGYSLTAFYDGYSHLLKDKLNNTNIKIRVIFVDPESVHSKTRAEVEGRNSEQFKDKIQTFRNYFDGKENIEIRFFNAPLSTMIFKIDKVMFVGPHLYKIQSKASFTFEIKSGHWLFEEYQNEFDRMWNDAEVP